MYKVKLIETGGNKKRVESEQQNDTNQVTHIFIFLRTRCLYLLAR